MMAKPDEVYFGRGTTPERVARAVEEATRDRDRSRPRPSTSERERYFKHIAEEKKRAEAGS